MYKITQYQNFAWYAAIFWHMRGVCKTRTMDWTGLDWTGPLGMCRNFLCVLLQVTVCECTYVYVCMYNILTILPFYV